MEFRCKNQRCINVEYICDREDDCGDNSDEINCKSFCNSSNQFSCENGFKCLDNIFKCNGVSDCSDGTDEENCFQNTYNKTKMSSIGCPFVCKSGECLPSLHFVCDGKKDCFDGSDENDCNSTTNCTNQFRCITSGHCISQKKKCDRIPYDCEDNSDESDCCFSPNRKCLSIRDNRTICLDISRFCDGRKDCSNGEDEDGFCSEDHCFNSHCSGSCHNMPEGYTCLCPEGLILSSDNSTCIHDSCNVWGVCGQICIQLNSSRHQCQ